MSLTITTDVFCDGDDCPAWAFGVVGLRPDGKRARAQAKRAGWTIRRGRDLCPECAKLEANP